MALSRLSLPTMAAMTRHWRSAAQPVFDARPLLTGLTGVLATLEDDFEALRLAADGSEQITALRAEASALDVTHDTNLGRVHGYLTAVAELLPADDAEAARALRDRLMPDGLSMKQRTYQEQGTAAHAARADLTDADRAALEALSPARVDLLGATLEWIDAGIKLAKVDAQRAALEETPPEGVPDGRAVRLRWITAAKGVRAMAAMDQGLSVEQRALLLAKLDEEEQRADARRARANRDGAESAEDTPAESDADTPTDTVERPVL